MIRQPSAEYSLVICRPHTVVRELCVVERRLRAVICRSFASCEQILVSHAYLLDGIDHLFASHSFAWNGLLFVSCKYVLSSNLSAWYKCFTSQAKAMSKLFACYFPGMNNDLSAMESDLEAIRKYLPVIRQLYAVSRVRCAVKRQSNVRDDQ